MPIALIMIGAMLPNFIKKISQMSMCLKILLGEIYEYKHLCNLVKPCFIFIYRVFYRKTIGRKND